MQTFYKLCVVLNLLLKVGLRIESDT